jgi:hypothetical protein
MRRPIFPSGILGAAIVVGFFMTTLGAQTPAPLAGTWAINRTLSEFPRDVGFNPSWLGGYPPGSGGAPAGGQSGGGRGRRGGGGGTGRGSAGSPFSSPQESYEDAQRRTVLTDEVHAPPARLTIVDTPAAVTVTSETGQSRTFHPDGKDETIQVGSVSVRATSRRDGDALSVLYHVSQGRDLRYIYLHSNAPAQLVVDIQFLERGSGDRVRRVYEPASTTTEAPVTPAGAPTATAAAPTNQAVDQRPGAELRGLNTVGIVVEGVGEQAAACGLSGDGIETSITKQLTDAGFTVHKNQSDDAYVYINVVTGSLPSGSCVSRYDASIYTHAAAKPPYGDRPVLMQVLLLHRGGMGSSAASGHATAVGRGLQDFIAQFIAQIRDANK